LFTPSIKKSWTQASDDCATTAGATLTAVESQCEQNFVHGLTNNVDTWLGGSDSVTEGTLLWQSSSTVFYTNNAVVQNVYTNFLDGQPNPTQTDNQDCLIMKTAGEWDEVTCTRTEQYMCQLSASVGANTATQPPTTTQACAQCDVGWTRLDCKCYRVEQDTQTWVAAQSKCQGLKSTSNLATISSAEVEAMLLNLAGGPSTANEYWTGGNDIATDKNFVWALDNSAFYNFGSPVVNIGYKNWYEASVIQPNHASNQDCVKMKMKIDDNGALEKMGWDDVSCSKTLKYACQYNL